MNTPKVLIDNFSGFTESVAAVSDGKGGTEITREFSQDLNPFYKFAETARNDNAGYWHEGKVRDMVHLARVPYFVALEIKEKCGLDMWKANLKDEAVKVELFAAIRKLGYSELCFLKKGL